MADAMSNRIPGERLGNAGVVSDLDYGEAALELYRKLR